MINLKIKTIGNLQVVLQVVPSREGVLLQRFLAQELTNAFSKGATSPVASLSKITSDNKSGKDVLAGGLIAVSAIAELLNSMDDDKFIGFINRISKFIFIDGKKLDLDSHFTTDTLIDLYQVIFFFLEGTFSGFLAEIRSRFPQLELMIAMSKKFKVPTSTGISGDPA